MSVSHQNLFAEFPPISKADWLNKIEKDLKGRPLSELDWQLHPLSIAAFLHAEDFTEMPEPILDNRSANSWLVGEDIEVTDFKAANKQVLAALMAGVNAPRFVFDDYPTKEQLSVLLADIELDFIVTCFKEKNENRSPLAFLKNVKEIAGAKALDIKGTIHYDPFADGRHDVKAASDVISWASENLPNFTVITVNVERFRTNTDLSREHREGVVSELANALSAGEKYLNKLTANGLSADLVQKSMAFRFQVGDAYFVEIAKLRAFKLLWGNVLSAYNVAPSTPRLLVYTEVYLNGTLAVRELSFNGRYDSFEILPAAQAHLKPGAKILLAIHCHQTNGGQYIDAGFDFVKEAVRK